MGELPRYDQSFPNANKGFTVSNEDDTAELFLDFLISSRSDESKRRLVSINMRILSPSH